MDIITRCTFFLSVSCSVSWLTLPGWMVDLSFSSTDRPSVRFSSAGMAVVRGFTGWGLEGRQQAAHRVHRQVSLLCGFLLSPSRLSGEVMTPRCRTGGPQLPIVHRLSAKEDLNLQFASLQSMFVFDEYRRGNQGFVQQVIFRVKSFKLSYF